MWATNRRNWFTTLASLVACQVLRAQPTPTVTEADIERMKRSQPVITEQDVQRARDRHRAPTDAELRSVPVPGTPKIDALPKPATATPIDLEALARGFDAQAGKLSLGQTSGPALLVFISFAMPEATLKRLVEQASRSQATLVLRGLVDGSLVRTASRVQQLIAGRRVAVQIDPQAFDRYVVTKTPTFVLMREGAQLQACAGGQCVPADGFVMASGDVSLDYALGFIRRSTPAFSKDANRFLQRLRS